MKTIALAIAWTLIVVPLGWGVYQSVQKSMPLFQGVDKGTGYLSSCVDCIGFDPAVDDLIPFTRP